MSVDRHHRDTSRHRSRGARRLASSIFTLVTVAAVWMVGCGEPQPPAAVGSIPELTVEVGSTESVDLAAYFSDPNGDELSYAALSSNADVATVAISGNSVAVTGVARGSAGIIVAASDGAFEDSHAALQDFTAFVRLSDRQVLEILYDELGGDRWRNYRNWKTNKPLDEWYAVRTNADGRVDSLDLRQNRLTGKIPPELGDLRGLSYLSLDNNSLTGEIPPEVGSLSSLRILYLHDNRLSGAIPPELGDLSNLEFLTLSHNRLSGAIPRELGGLSNLRSLGLGFNPLTGEIPPELGSLSKLGELYLSASSLTGEIPPEFLDLSLYSFYWDDSEGLCAPNTIEFDEWLEGIDRWLGPRCD